MKKTLVISMLALTIALAGCGNKEEDAAAQTAPADAAATTEQTAETAQTTENTAQAPEAEADKAEAKTEKSTVNVMPAAIDITNGFSGDATVRVYFTADNFEMKDDHYEMTAAVYVDDLYDSGDIDALAAGDEIECKGNMITVDTVDRTETGLVNINGGIGESETGFSLIPDQDGTYRYFGMDGESAYTEIGFCTVPVSQDCVLTDERMLVSETSITVDGVENVKAYIDTVKNDGFGDFNEYQTEIVVKGGEAKEIHLLYRP